MDLDSRGSCTTNIIRISKTLLTYRGKIKIKKSKKK